MRILVTGGAGYIGSHTCVELIAAGHSVVIIDNLSNSKIEALARVEHITGRPVDFVHADIRDAGVLNGIFAHRPVDAVVHFAGLKVVGESVAKPLEYYDNNVYGSVVLLRAMRGAGVRTIVFSSSAAVYGELASSPIREDSPLRPSSPYGRSKLMVEQILRDAAASEAGWRLAILRYFNPVGAHPSGLIGEDPFGVPNNLMPSICQVAAGRLKELTVFGNEYSTRDGTGVRDYIHVVDLARGHLAALAALMTRATQSLTANLGSGRAYSVLEVVRAFESATGHNIPLRMADHRSGDIAECCADAGFACEVLGWRAERTIEDMCRDAWHWQSENPNGYQ